MSKVPLYQTVDCVFNLGKLVHLVIHDFGCLEHLLLSWYPIKWMSHRPYGWQYGSELQGYLARKKMPPTRSL